MSAITRVRGFSLLALLFTAALALGQGRMSPAPSAEEIARSKKTWNETPSPEESRITGSVARPSSTYRTFNADGYFSLSVPDNWKELEVSSSITFAPDGAYGTPQGEPVITHGLIVGVISNASSADMRAASDQYVSGILQQNAYLKSNGTYQRIRFDGRDALKRRLSGNSPVTQRKEMVDIYTVVLHRGQLFYMVQVVPVHDQGKYTRAFSEIVRSLRFVN